MFADVLSRLQKLYEVCLFHIESRACSSLRCEDVVIVWRSPRMSCCPVGHLDGFFQASPDYSRQLSVIVKPALIV